jgi:predicted dehydrogenase
VLVNDPEVFGAAAAGTQAEPGVSMESVHYLAKSVAGVPLRRPPWFFDVAQQGEGLSDVGTHLVDLVMGILYPGQAIDHRTEVRVLAAERWPTVLTRADYQQVTGDADFAEVLRPGLRDGRLDYYCNTRVSYTVRGVHVLLNVLWDFEAAAGAGDTHFAVFRGTRSHVEVRQGKDQGYRPELYVVPKERRDGAAVGAALRRQVAALQAEYPGVAVEPQDGQFWVTIPDRYRVGHEAHFAEVTGQFLRYLHVPSAMPPWERANMLAKYYVTTEGVRRSREGPGP